MSQTPVSWHRRLADWLRTRWQLATIPETQRCSFCTNRYVIEMTDTKIEGNLTYRRTTRYCDDCHRSAALTPAAQMPYVKDEFDTPNTTTGDDRG